MSACFSCGSHEAPGIEKCTTCGQEFHHTRFAVFKSAKKTEHAKVTVLQRFLAVLIDGVYLSAPIVISLFFLPNDFRDTTFAEYSAQSWFIFLIFGVFQLFLLVHDGQTVGKKLMKIAIVDHKTMEHPSAFRILVLRTLVPIIPFVLPPLGILFSLVNSAWIFGSEQRCLHDLIAGTEVVHE